MICAAYLHSSRHDAVSVEDHNHLGKLLLQVAMELLVSNGQGGEEVLERHGRTPLQSTDNTRSYPATKYRQRVEKRSWRDTVVPRYKVQTKGGEEVLERHGRTPLQSTDKRWRRGPGETRSYPATKYRQRVEKRSWRDTVVPRYKVQTTHGRTPLQSTDNTRSYPAKK